MEHKNVEKSLKSRQYQRKRVVHGGDSLKRIGKLRKLADRLMWSHRLCYEF